ncbi:MAG: GNAT family N-acetyltransferase [Devosia sp.]
MAAITRASAADQTAIAALIDAAYAQYIPTIGRKPRPMLDDHAARIARGEHFVHVTDAGLQAVITLTQGRPDALHIFSIAVHPGAQGRGLLRQLLGFAEGLARQRDLHWLTLHTNVAMVRNRAIYTRLGFVELGEEEGNGYRIVLMQRPVPPA